jgi:hypothetical protein
VWVELAGEKHARRLEDLIRTPRVRDLTAQLLDLLALLAAQQVLALALISFSAPHIFAQRLRLDAQVAGDVGNRAAGLEHKSRATLQQLLGILPRSCHNGRLSSPRTKPQSDQNLRQNQPGSSRAHGYELRWLRSRRWRHLSHNLAA